MYMANNIVIAPLFYIVIILASAKYRVGWIH